MTSSDDDKHLVLLLSIIICVIISIGGSVAYNFGLNESNPSSDINFNLNSQEFKDNSFLDNTNSKPVIVKASSGINWNLKGTKTVYLTSDRIVGKKSDRKFLERIRSNLQKAGIKVIIDPGASHPNQVPRAIKNAPKGSAVIIINYNCAGTIKDLCNGISGPQTNGHQNKGYLYNHAKDLTGIIYVNVSPKTLLTDKTYLSRAQDDNFSPRSFKGINNPAKYLLDNGIALIDSPKPYYPVMGIERADIISSQIIEMLKL